MQPQQQLCNVDVASLRWWAVVAVVLLALELCAHCALSWPGPAGARDVL